MVRARIALVALCGLVYFRGSFMKKIDWIKDPKGALRHYTTIALAFLAFLNGALVLMPAEILAKFPPVVSQYMGWVLFGTAVAGLFGKFVDQSPKALE